MMPQQDDPLSSFREERLDQRKKRPAILIGVASGIVIALTVGWLTFGKYVSLSYQAANGELPVIHADSSPDGMAPKFAGGLDVPDRDKMVYERLRQTNTDLPVERLLAPAEKPKPPVAPMSADDDPIGDLAEKIAEQDTVSAVVTDEDGQPVEVVFKTVQTAPKQAVKPEPKPAVQPQSKEEPKQETKTSDAVYSVQLVSARSKEAAEGEWKRLSKKYSDLMADIPHTVSEITSANGTFYRLRVGAYPFHDQAKNLCDQFKAKNQECFVVK